MSEVINVKAPATSANVGPGFDVFAFALNLYNEASFEMIEKGLEISGCPKEFRNERNLAYRAYKAVFEITGKKMGGLRLIEKNQIPFCRGLGSSAAMIAEGAVSANEMLGSPLDKSELLEVCLKIEPHPDNLAACIYGGFTSAIIIEDNHVVRNTDVSDHLDFYAIISDQQVSTDEARLVLPKDVSLTDAVFNISRASMLQNAFESGNKHLLSILLQDRIHEPYRKNLIDDFDAVKSIAYSSGAYAFYISGSGSTCIAMSDKESFIDDMNKHLIQSEIKRKVIKLKASNEGTKRI